MPRLASTERPPSPENAPPANPWDDLAASERKLRQRFDEDIGRIRARLKIFDSDALAAGIGGLHLVSANAPFSARLAIAARLAAELPARDGVAPDWNWLNGWTLDHWGLGALDDPLEDLFCDEVGFTGGPYLVLPSNFGDDFLPTKHLLRALFARSDDRLPLPLDEELFGLTICVLRLSDAVARRAGLHRGLGDESRQRREVQIPPRRDMREFSRAVRFSEAELVGEVHPEALRHLASLLHVPPCLGSDEALTHNGLAATPLRRTGDGLIVAFPRQLLSALRHQLCLRLSPYPKRKDLVRALHRSLTQEVDFAARRMGWSLLGSKRPRIGRGGVVSWHLHAFDANKIANVAVVTDALEGYPKDDVNPRWPNDGLFERIDRDQRSFAARASGDVLSVCLTQPIGRYSPTGKMFGADGRHRWLALSVDEFRVIGILEAADPLALWKFAAACADVAQRMEVYSWDLLSLYESHRHLHGGLQTLLSHPADRPATLVLQPGSGSTLKLEIAQLVDPHLERFPRPPILVEVARSYRQAQVPIYESVHSQRPSRVVRALGGAIWIHGPEDLAPHTDAYDLHDGLADVVAYWLWQLDTVLGPALGPRDPLFIEVAVPDVSDWERDRQVATTGPIVTCAPIDDGVRLTLMRGAAARCCGPDNAGEREIMRVLVGVLLAGDAQLRARCEALLDVVIPPGPKRRIPRGDDRPNLHRRGLPPIRGLQAIDELRLDRALGTYLRDELQRRPGLVPNVERTSVLNAAVQWCFDRLEERIARLQPETLLDALLLYHERLIYEDYVSRNSVESEVRCWSSAAEVEARLRESMPRFASVLGASRFLIEYAAARPPTGAEPLGLAAYDELLALAHRIFELGISSDGIHCGVVDQSVRIDHEGRLRFHAHGESAAAARGATHALAHDAIQGATLPVEPVMAGEHDRGWSRPYADAWQRLDRAFEAVEGFTVEDVAHGLNALLAAVAEDESEVLRLPLTAAIDAVAHDRKWPQDRARRLVAFLSLEPRAAFLRPPSADMNDALPWKYNRQYSYVRRPLLRRGDEILFGERHVVSAKLHLFHLCREGRLRRAPGTELDRALNALRQLDGRAFNDYVAARFKAPRFRVATRVTKIGGRPLQRSAGQPIGDIDVLVADTEYHVLCSIDTKDHAQARNPREIANEVQTLFVGSPGVPSMVAAHFERDTWLRGHVKDALRHLHLDPAESDRWRVASLLVFDEVLASIAHRSPVELVTINELETRLAQGGPLVGATNRASRDRATARGRRGSP